MWQKSQADPKVQKDYKAEYKKLKAKIALLEANPSTSQTLKTFQLKNKGLVAETFDWDEEEVSDDEEVTWVKVLMALADDELTVRKNHARNGEWIDITMKKVNILLSMGEDANWQNYLKYINIDLMFVEEQRLNLLSKYNKIVFELLNKCRDELLVLKQAKLDAVTFQVQNTKLTNQCISEQIPYQKKKVLCGELLTGSSSKRNENENLFVPASMGYDQEMVPKTKDSVKRLNTDSKLPYFNTGRILVPESQAVNESLETSNTHESSKDSKAEFLTSLPPLKILQGALPSSEEDHRTSDHEMYIASLKRSENYKAQSYQYASSSKQILRVKAKPFPPCTHYGFNDHIPDDYRNYPECGISCEKGKHHKASFKTKQNFSIRKCLHLLYMDLFRPAGLMSINPEKYTLVIVDEYSRLVENKNDVNVKQIRTDNRTEFRNHELKSFYDDKGISQNLSSPYTPEQNGTDAVRIACYTQNGSIIVKIHDKTSYEILRERIPNITYIHVFGCPMFIHNYKDHVGKFNAKADDRYFLGYSSVLKAFRIYNTRRQQIEETYHVTFDKSIEAIRITNTSVNEIGINDSSRYPPDELQEDDPSSSPLI
ncbi:retrovirus-related pol polyprotein from transposon TNT 1-94 [Tanacetum coccineum]